MPTDLDQSRRDAQDRVTRAWQWIHDFPVNPHPDLGRSGPVCPYMGRALRQKFVELFEFDARQGDEACIERLRQLREDLRQRGATLGEDAIYLVYFLVPYGLPEADLTAMMQRVHKRVRPEFVSSGMLAGDFWPAHEAPGLHSRQFRPFDSPLALFPIRHMVPADLPFFSGRHVPAHVRVEYLTYYRQFFADRLPESWRRRLAEAERVAHADLQADQPAAMAANPTAG
jgi:hypothetical protein